MKVIRKCAGYLKDIENDFIEDLVQYKGIICGFDVELKLSIIFVGHLILKLNTFVILYAYKFALRIFCSLPCSNIPEERSFSILKKVRTIKDHHCGE